MKLILVALVGFMFMGCTKTISSSISPLQGVACDVESAVAGAEASAVANLLTCTNSTQIQSDLMTALGNANLCAASGVQAVQASQLKAAVGKNQAKGLVGNIACPIVVNVLVGYATQSIPTAWGCSAGATAQSLGAALTAACETAVPL